MSGTSRDTTDITKIMSKGKKNRRGTSKGKKTESSVSAELGELKSCSSEVVATGIEKINTKLCKSEDCQDSSQKSSDAAAVNIDPLDMERKCSIGSPKSEKLELEWTANFQPSPSVMKCTCAQQDATVSVTNAEDTNVQQIENSKESSGNLQKLKNMKHVKEPHSPSSTKKSDKKLLKRLEINQFTSFMKDFDPEKSQREARKLENLPFSGVNKKEEEEKKKKEEEKKKEEKKKGHKDNRQYDENGIFIETGEDLCDCLIDDCPGCHFPCRKCRSCKCGHVCRRNRKWCYDEIEIEGTGIIIKRKQ